MTQMHHESMGTDYEPIRVKIDNVQDLKVTRTEELEPEHFTTSSFPLPAAGPPTSGPNANLNVPVQILELDPLRKEAILFFNGVAVAPAVPQILLAHTQTLAVQLQQATDQATEGMLITCPGSFKVEGTGPLWAVAAAGANAPSNPVVSVLQSRRGR